MTNLRFVFALLVPALVAGVACSVNNTTAGSGSVPCDELAARCPYCTSPSIKQACENALGTHDPGSCQNALNDRDVQASCVAPSSSSGGASSSSSSGGAS